MNTNFKKLALAAITLSGLSIATLGLTAAPAAARVVCDWDGDDCRRVPGYYDRDYDRDWHRDWHERREWEERRDAWRHTYWGRPYDPYWERPYSRGNVWFSF